MGLVMLLPVLVLICVIIVGTFSVGVHLAKKVFKTNASRIWGGLLFGFGCVFLLFAAVFVGCSMMYGGKFD